MLIDFFSAVAAEGLLTFTDLHDVKHLLLLVGTATEFLLTCEFTSGIKEVLLRLWGCSHEQSRWAGSAAVGARCHEAALPASFQLALCSVLMKIAVVGTLWRQQDAVVSLSDIRGMLQRSYLQYDCCRALLAILYRASSEQAKSQMADVSGWVKIGLIFILLKWLHSNPALPAHENQCVRVWGSSRVIDVSVLWAILTSHPAFSVCFSAQ